MARLDVLSAADRILGAQGAVRPERYGELQQHTLGDIAIQPDRRRANNSAR